jgi:hypothetical protein
LIDLQGSRELLAIGQSQVNDQALLKVDDPSAGATEEAGQVVLTQAEPTAEPPDDLAYSLQRIPIDRWE